MSGRSQPQPSRNQGTQPFMSASGDGRVLPDPNRPGYTGRSSGDVSGQSSRNVSRQQPTLEYDTSELLASANLQPTHPLYKLKNNIMPGGRQEHTLGSGTQEMPADMLGDNDLVRQGLPNTSSVSQGKQKVPQKGQGSTARPSAGTSHSLVPAEKTPEENLKDLLDSAMKVPRNKDRIPWPREHDDFLKGYIDLYENLVDHTISWKAMRNEYKDFLRYYPQEQLYRKRQSMREN